MKVLYIFCFIFIISFAISQDFPNYQDKYVNDFANVLSSDQELYLRELFHSVEENSTAQIVFISVSECAPLTPNEYATRIGQFWGVGMADVDNGLVLLYCNSEKKFYSATGYGLEGILPDSKLGRLLDEYYVPKRDAGDAPNGIVSFAEVVSNEIILNSDEVTSKGSKSSNIFLIIGIVIFFIVSFVYVSKLMTSSMGLLWYRLVLGIIFIILGAIFISTLIGIVLFLIGFFLIRGKGIKNEFGHSGVFGGSSGGSFGGGGFGGGSFGGGGAGR